MIFIISASKHRFVAGKCFSYRSIGRHPDGARERMENISEFWEKASRWESWRALVIRLLGGERGPAAGRTLSGRPVQGPRRQGPPPGAVGVLGETIRRAPALGPTGNRRNRQRGCSGSDSACECAAKSGRPLFSLLSSSSLAHTQLSLSLSASWGERERKEKE